MPDKERKATLLLDEKHGILEESQSGLLPHLRATLPDQSLQWLDTVLLLQSGGTRAAPLFISGGNDGNFDFSVTFIGFLQTLFTESDLIRDRFTSAVFAEGLVASTGGTAGHFNPAGLGGPNGGQGFAGSGSVNPWDFVLMIEGALLLAGAITRRYEVNTTDRVAFPFCAAPVATGFGSAAANDETSEGCRAELWLPLWSSDCSLAEIQYLFAEGRAQLGRKQAHNAVEFALATCLLGMSRGIESFVRFGFLRRFGKMFLAAQLGRVPVTLRPSARLLDEKPLAEWLSRLRSACRDKDKTPARYQTALHQIHQAIYSFAVRSESGKPSDRHALIKVLRTFGRAENILSKGLSFCIDKEGRIRVPPLRGLSPQWLDQADDGSREFRLAASLAGIRGHGEVGPFRVFLEPVEYEGKSFQWPKDKNKTAVWSNRPLASNLAAVFTRRLMEAFRDAQTWGQTGVPLDSPRCARLEDVIAFLHGEIDDEKFADLVWGLSALDWPTVDSVPPEGDNVAIPFEFGVPRLLVEPRTITATKNRWTLTVGAELNAIPDPEVFQILASGQSDAVGRCVDRAAHRLKSGGRPIVGHRNRRLAGHSLAILSPVRADRLLAAMLFPLSNRDLEIVANAVLYPPEPEV